MEKKVWSTDYNLGRIVISSAEFWKYREFIDSLLSDIYKGNLMTTEEGITQIKPLSFENGKGRYASIINYLHTNTTVLEWFVRTFEINSFQEMIQKMRFLREELYYEKGKYFKEMMEILTKTVSIGEVNEKIAVDYVTKLLKNKTGNNIVVENTPLCSYDDMVLGIDLYIKNLEDQYGCQVKPLFGYSLKGGRYIIESKGNIKKYKTQLICFVNRQTQSSMLFKNIDVIINENTMSFPEKALVKFGKGL